MSCIECRVQRMKSQLNAVLDRVSSGEEALHICTEHDSDANVRVQGLHHLARSRVERIRPIRPRFNVRARPRSRSPALLRLLLHLLSHSLHVGRADAAIQRRVANLKLCANRRASRRAPVLCRLRCARALAEAIWKIVNFSTETVAQEKSSHKRDT